MKKIYNRTILFTAITIGSIVGIFKGTEAKQKWMFKILSKQDERQTRAVRKSEARKGKVLLDDIEMAAYHKS